MDHFLQFFGNMESWQKLAWIFMCLGIAWFLEFIIPLVDHGYNKLRHIGVNLIFLSTSLVINLLFGIATLYVFKWVSLNNFGLLNIIDLPVIVELAIAVLALDFIAQYLIHVLLHKVSFMWRFHMIHHSDTKVDATTGTRHHPGDYFFRELFGIVTIFLLGAPLAFYVFYKVATILFTYAGHANIIVPKRLDRILSYVFITPNMHKFHHHFERPWTDTNFGNIFSFWDRIFGTLIYEDPKKVVYGLDVLDGKKDENVAYQFKIPFDKSIKTDY